MSSITHKTPMTASSESGFSLLELLLVIGVAGIIMLGITTITRSWVDSETSNNAGQHLAHMSSIVQKYVDTRGLTLPESVDVLADALIPGSAWEELYDTLEQEGYISDTGALTSPLGVDYRITYVADTTNQIYRASIISLENVPNKRALQVARHIGMTGGTVTTTPASPTVANNAIGAFGQWNIVANELVPASAPFPCARTQTRGCIVSVLSYTRDELCGLYLYRTPGAISLCPNGSRMETGLNMNNQNINNALNINTRDLDVVNTANLGNTTVNGPANFNGPTTVANGLNVSGGMNVTGNASFSDTVNMNGGGTLNVATLNASDVRSPTIRTNNLDAEDLNVSGAMLVEDNMTVNGNVAVYSSGSVPSSIYTNTVNAGTINANGGAISAGRMTVQNTMTVNGGLRITGTTPATRTVITDRLVVDECTRINSLPPGSSDFGSC